MNVTSPYPLQQPVGAPSFPLSRAEERALLMNDPESPFLCETMAEVVRSKVKMSRDLLVILATSSIEMHETQKFAGFVANFWSTFALFYFFFFILFYLPVVFSFSRFLFFFFFFSEGVSVSPSFRRSVRLSVTHEFFLNKIAPGT